MQSSQTLPILLLMILSSLSPVVKSLRTTTIHRLHPSFITTMSHYQNKRKHLSSSNEEDAQTTNPLYRAQGLVAVHKPLTWTSQDVVSYIRGILTRDAQDRNALGGGGGGGKRGKRKKQMLKVGHGGTLDPLASGVLVLGIGSGTTKLQSYLEGSKQYVAACELGYETTTLDAEGDIVKQMEYNQITSISNIEEVLPKFRGEISQVPPLYSAIRVDGKRLYEIARKGEKKGDDGDKNEVEIPTRQVVIHELEVGTTLENDVIESGVVNGRKYREVATEKKKQAADEAESKVEDVDNEEGNKNDHRGKKQGRYNKNKNDKKKNLFSDETIPMISSADSKFELPQFTLKMSCGGGTYVRSLVRDIGYECGSVATMTGLVRTKQGPFLLSDALKKEDWNADSIYNAIERNNESVEAKDDKVEAKA